MFWKLVLRYRNKIATICMALIAAIKLFWAIWYRGEKVEQMNSVSDKPPDPQIYTQVPAEATTKPPVSPNIEVATTIEGSATLEPVKPTEMPEEPSEPTTDDLIAELKDQIKKAE